MDDDRLIMPLFEQPPRPRCRRELSVKTPMRLSTLAVRGDKCLLVETMVETMGLEPTTPCVQGRCSSH